MKVLVATRPTVLLVAGAIVMGALAFGGGPAASPNSTPTLGFWEAAARGFVSAVVVNETFEENGHSVTLPVGIEVTNTANMPVVLSEEAVLMSPHPSQSPQPTPTNTTADAVLTTNTIPAQGSLLYSYGEYVLAGFLTGPMWWDLEETQFAKAGVAFHVGGETLPLALRSLVEHPYYNGLTDNTQTALWAYLRSYPTVVVGKQPLWSAVNDNAGQTIRVRIDATNMALWAYDDAYAASVNVTNGRIEDTVPAGWTVEEGSYSVPPDTVVNNADGTQTLEWIAPIAGAQVSQETDPTIPTAFTTVTRFYTLVTPALDPGNYSLPAATSDMNQTGTADAHSAPPVVFVPPNTPPVADAGGPYSGNEGDTIVLSAAASRDPDRDPLQFRWSFTDNGTWDTDWSSTPAASVTYTDEFSGRVRVEVSDGHTSVGATSPVTIVNVPPSIESLVVTANASAEFRLTVAGRKGGAVTFVLQNDGSTVASLRVVRTPGSPEQQSLSSGMVPVNLSRSVEAWVLYTPATRGDDESFGDNPTWLAITLPNGTAVNLFHNFNAQHAQTWNWSLASLTDLIRPNGLTLQAHFVDPGSDGLTAVWEFGDGTTATQIFLTGTMSDSPESPVGGAAPMDVLATISHVYAAAGSYTITLTVTDSDGASATATLSIHVS